MAPQEADTTPGTSGTSGAKTADTRVANRRLGGRKDRTGCITCKIRRVKCDEEKPACRRCTSTGRTCDGYAPTVTLVPRQQLPKQQVPRPHHAALQRAPRANPWLCARPRHLVGGGVSVASQQEHLAFQFFVQTGASSLAGCTDVEFWTRLVPQRAQADAAIYHASVAVGALLMGAHYAMADQSTLSTLSTLSTPLTPLPLRTQLTTLAIERQNRAIQSTVRGMASASPSKRPTNADAVTFILLFCIEALQGREVEALQLFQHGIQALAAQSSKTAATRTHTMATGLAAQLDRIRLQCGMFNAGTANTPSPARKRALARLLASPPAGPFTSLDAARDEMSELIAVVQHTVAARWGDADDTASDATRNAAQSQALEAALHGWRVRFARYIASSREPKDVVMASLLRLRDLIALIWMADAPGRSEMIYDGYVGAFADIAAEAERCLRGMRGEGQNQLPAPFTFEMGLIPPLYWALLKCRHPRLRRRLLALLRQAPAQEGLWSRDIMIQVAERVIAHEEGHGWVGDSVGHASSASPDGDLDLLLPPEELRIKIVRINLRTTLADGRQGDQVMCFGMPHGVGGGLHVVLEFDALFDTTK